MSNNVNHPDHYQSESGLEVIDVIKAFTSELSGEEAFCIGNAIKYICRYSKKNGVEDLEKAKWYIDRAISVRSERLTTIKKNLNAIYGAKNVQKMGSDYSIGRVLFASREEAGNVLKELRSIVDDCGHITLADLYEVCELCAPSPVYRNIGWKSVDDFRIIPTDDGWKIVFYEWPRRIEDN